jgi:hypothetical protein
MTSQRLCQLVLASTLPIFSTLSYNDCTRTTGPPDVQTVPVWNGVLETFFDDYRPLADIDKFVTELQAAHPLLITIKQIGLSWEQRPLRVMEITSGGANVSATKPLIFLEGGIHAREWIATSTVLSMAYRLVTQAGVPDVAAMLAKYTFAIIAPINPDGYAYTWTVNRFWRKTRSNREQCAWAADRVAGVDANRNWGYTRGIIAKTPEAEQTTDLVDPCRETFEGPVADSEPEVKAVVAYLRARQRLSLNTGIKDPYGKTTPGAGYVTAFFDYHSFCMYLLPPWGYSAMWPSAPDGPYMQMLGKSMAAAIRASTGNIFRVGPDLLPADPGTAPDWAYGELGIRATMTVELEGHETTSSFCLPKERIEPVGREQFDSLKALVAHLQQYGDQPSVEFGLFAGSPPPPAIVPIRLWMERQGLWSNKQRPMLLGAGIIFLASLGVLVWSRSQKHSGVRGVQSQSIQEEGIE